MCVSFLCVSFPASTSPLSSPHLLLLSLSLTLSIALPSLYCRLSFVPLIAKTKVKLRRREEARLKARDLSTAGGVESLSVCVARRAPCVYVCVCVRVYEVVCTCVSVSTIHVREYENSLCVRPASS